MAERDETQRRLEALEARAADAAAARILAAGAHRDVGDVRAELRAHTSTLDALRETQVEQGRTLDKHTALLDKHTKLLMAHSVILAGQGELLESHSRKLDEHSRKLAEHDRRFDEHDRRFDDVDRRFDDVDRQFGEVDHKLDHIIELLTPPAGSPQR